MPRYCVDPPTRGHVLVLHRHEDCRTLRDANCVVETTKQPGGKNRLCRYCYPDDPTLQLLANVAEIRRGTARAIALHGELMTR